AGRFFFSRGAFRGGGGGSLGPPPTRARRGGAPPPPPAPAARPHTTATPQHAARRARSSGGHQRGVVGGSACRAARARGRQAGRGIFLFDGFGSVTRYDTETRALIDERIKRRKPGYSRRIIMVVRPTPIWRMAMQVTDLTLALLRIPPAKVTGDMERAAAEI